MRSNQQILLFLTDRPTPPRSLPHLSTTTTAPMPQHLPSLTTMHLHQPRIHRPRLS
ncbi:hypothetical protein BDV93DRAFT_517337 [Ceratobasidium sp. AG-I]|nr:hypothetical protein BDV93DRAFT_517337 [Ceratobasidium sp. AG-I]